MYLTPEAAAEAWVAENPHWEVEGDQWYLTYTDRAHSKKPKRVLVMCGTWSDFATGLMRSGLIKKTDEGWVIVSA